MLYYIELKLCLLADIYSNNIFLYIINIKIVKTQMTSVILGAFKDISTSVVNAGSSIGQGITHGQGAMCPMNMVK